MRNTSESVSASQASFAGQKLGQRPPVAAEREERLPEARRADGVGALVAPVDHRADELDDLVRVTAAVFLLLQLVDRLGALVEALGPDG